jgi:hypothetical protein
MFDGLGAAEAFNFMAITSDAGVIGYQDVVLEADETAVYMFVEAQRDTITEADAFAQTSDGTDDLYAGMDPADRQALRNWPVSSDADGDGDRITADNCEGVSNADQADLDGDGSGDACDGDDDADGLPDTIEQALGSDPRKADSDGDGRNDGADACPTRRSSEPDGCPASVAATPGAATAGVAPAGDTSASGRASSSLPLRLGLGDVAARISRRSLLRRGVRAQAACNLPCSLRFELIRGGTVVASRTLADAAGRRSVRLRPKRAGRRAALTVRVTATTAGGQEVQASRGVAVR